MDYEVKRNREEERRQEAAERNSRWKKLTPAEQLLELDRRLGKGIGAQKQRARLQKKISSDSK